MTDQELADWLVAQGIGTNEPEPMPYNPYRVPGVSSDALDSYAFVRDPRVAMAALKLCKRFDVRLSWCVSQWYCTIPDNEDYDPDVEIVAKNESLERAIIQAVAEALSDER